MAVANATSPREGESLPGRLRWSNQREGRNRVGESTKGPENGVSCD